MESKDGNREHNKNAKLPNFNAKVNCFKFLIIRIENRNIPFLQGDGWCCNLKNSKLGYIFAVFEINEIRRKIFMNDNNVKASLKIEPEDKYGKARMHVIQAMKSMQELTPQQREQLAKELFGIEAVAYIQSMIQYRHWK